VLEFRIENSEFSMKKNTARTFEDLIVWQKAHAFALSIYSFSSTFPKSEMFGLISQFRRAAVSLPANIAEGFRKKSNKDKVRFYNISQGSIEECRYYLILANDLDYGKNQKINELLQEISKMLSSYISSLLNSESCIL
jgi:four helix bundle protein